MQGIAIRDRIYSSPIGSQCGTESAKEFLDLSDSNWRRLKKKHGF